MKIFKLIKDFFVKLKEKREFNKKIKEIKKRDPFTYNH
jgi:hypothetical protein